MKKPTVTIGIPAYNEEKNIAKLLSSLLLQNQKNLSLKEIVVVSDGSTDSTVKNAFKIKNKKISVINNLERVGVGNIFNTIIRITDADVLVLLDSDVHIRDKNFLAKLIDPIIKKKADLTSSSIFELTPGNFFSETLFVSMRIKENLFDAINGGNNIYTCHGLARAFSKKFYKEVEFPFSVGNDMYVYLACKHKKMKYQYVPEAQITYQLPKNLKDHEKQSTRFFNSKKKQYESFSKDFVKSETTIPYSSYVMALFNSFVIIASHPIHTIFYLFLVFFMKIKSFFVVRNELWETAISTKSI